MADTYEHPLLTPEEETRLAKTIEAGLLAAEALRIGDRPCGATVSELLLLEREGHDAWEKFLLANLRLVWMVARREARCTGLPVEDLFQEGFLALAGALQRFDHRRARFSTYALPRIRQRVAEVSAHRLGEVPLPGKRALLMRRALGLAAELSQEQGRTVPVSELADALGRSVSWTAELVSHEQPPACLDDVEPARLGTQPDAEGVDSAPCDSVRAAVRRLPQEQREVIQLRFGFGTGQPQGCAEVASRLRVSESTVRRLERRALARLRAEAVAC